MAERGLRLLVVCYPSSIRNAFEHDIAMTFRDAYMDRVRGPLSFLAFWARALWEGLATIPTAWWESWTGRRSRYALGGNRPVRRRREPRRNWGRVDALAHELRFAVRRVFRRPMFAAGVVGTLALGIVGVTTLGSIVWGVVLAPLPYPNADRLVGIWHWQGGGGPRYFGISPRQIEAFRGARTIEEITFIEGPGKVTLRTDGVAERVEIILTAGNLLSFLGAGIVLGRGYGPSDEAAADPVVVLAYDTWIRRYGADPDVLGTHVSIGARDYRVIGVLESDFRYVLRPNTVEYWIPRAHPMERVGYFYTALARMAPGVTPDDVSRELGPIILGLYEEAGHHLESRGVGPEDAATVRYVEEALLELYGHGPRVWVLFGLGAIVLLLACANVTSLLLVSASERSHELALRGAIGAGRARLAGHLLSEATVLSLLGGALGAALTPGALQLLKLGAPAGIPRLETVTVGWPMMTAVLLVTTATVLLVGTLPAWGHSRPRLQQGLKVNGAGSRGAPTTSRLRSGLLVAQVCGAFVMLLGTGLMIRSYRELATEDLGFKTDGILSGQVRLPTRLWESVGEVKFGRRSAAVVRGTPELAEVRRALTQQIAAHPAAGRVTLAHYSGGLNFRTEGSEWAEGEDRRVSTNAVDPSFFRVLGVKLLRGRFLNDADGFEGAAPVAVISDALARRFWPGEDALGKRFPGEGLVLTDGAYERVQHSVEVVGVVASLRERQLRLPDRTVFTPLNRAYGPTPMIFRALSLNFFIESKDRAAVAQHTRAVLAEVLPGEPLRRFGALEDVGADMLREPRFYAYLLGVFGTYAALLAGLGIAASVAAVVSRRRWEIGVRMVLGASRPAVLRLVAGRAAVLTMVGLVVGLGVGLFSARLLGSLLYGVSPLDPAMHLLTAVTLLGVAVTAASLPV
ncbi:MAG: ABC transporter permease, partial [Longimicrobiales bacterium]